MREKLIGTEIGSWEVTIYSQEFRKTYKFEYANTTKEHILEAILKGLFPKSEIEGAIFTELSPERIAEIEHQRVWDMF